MTDHVAITYLKSDAGKQLAVQAVPIGGIVPPIHPPQLLNPMQSVEFDIEAGEELIIAPASVLPQQSLARPAPTVAKPFYAEPYLDIGKTPAPVVKPLYTASPSIPQNPQGVAIPPLKGEWVPPVVPVVTGVSQR